MIQFIIQFSIDGKGNAFILCYTETIKMRFFTIFSPEMNPNTKEEAEFEQC